jgi:aryl-alcohol dehydrogenase-like predicted oxidoreductase
MLTQTTLGKSSLVVPKICLGTMTWGEQNTQAQAHSQLDWALANGVNFIDTAEMYPIPVKSETYTATETYIGQWLRHQDRSKVILASKVAGPGRTAPWVRQGLRANVGELSARDITLALDASLKRLNTDYLDLYQIHWPARNTPMFGQRSFDASKEVQSTSLLEQIETMHGFVKAGKIRAWGTSNETAWGIAQFQHLAQLHQLTPMATVQNVYNLLSRDFDRAMGEACFREDVSLLAYSPLAFGHLSGKYLNDAKPEGARITLYGDKWPRYSNTRISSASQAYQTIAHELGISMVQLALAFNYHNPLVGSTIIGATKLEQLEQCVQAFQTTLSGDTLKAIAAVHEQFTNPAL